MFRHIVIISLFIFIFTGAAVASQNQLQSVLGGGYNPEKISSAKAILGQSKEPLADIRAAHLKGYILAYLDQDYANFQAGRGKIDYCPTDSLAHVEQKVSEYIIATPSTVNEPFTKVIPDALRAQFPCK
ncbi:hypothetical protein S451_13050 [Salmonella enterica subsp. enterica]|nr:hypothetical protein [Salmonella enterica subsp. enterica]ECJ7251147.1 hypothetical protein [Salmonella enterica subsp. enterica]